MTEQPIERRVMDVAAVELAKLEGRVEQGFAKIEGQLEKGFAEARAEREARRVAEIAQQKQLDDHEQRIRDNTEDIRAVSAIANNAITPLKFWSVASGLLLVMAGVGGFILNAVK